MIGGAQIYAETLALAKRVVVTEIDADFEGMNQVLRDLEVFWGEQMGTGGLNTTTDPQEATLRTRGRRDADGRRRDDALQVGVLGQQALRLGLVGRDGAVSGLGLVAN